MLVVIVADRWVRWNWRDSDWGGEGAQLGSELGDGVACGGGEGLVVYRRSIEGMDGCFDDGESVAKRTDEVVCARRGRVGKGSRNNECVDLCAELLALESGGGVGGFEGCYTGLECVNGAGGQVIMCSTGGTLPGSEQCN